MPNFNYTKVRIAIGVLSILLSVPSFLQLISLVGFSGFWYSHWLIVQKLIIVICGILGGTFMLPSNKFGYIFLLIGFVFVLISNFFRAKYLFALNIKDIPSVMSSIQLGYELIISTILILLLWINWRKGKE